MANPQHKPKPAQQPAQPGKSPYDIAPYSQEAEEAVIGSVLVNPTCIYTLKQFLNAEDFFIKRHEMIWAAMLRLVESNEAIDYITLMENMGNRRLPNGRTELDEAGGDIYIIGLLRNIPTSQHAETYGHLVKRAAVRRRLLTASDEIRGWAIKEDVPLETAILESQTALDLALEHSLKDRAATLGEAMATYREKFNNPQAEFLGIPTGYNALDEILQGLHREDVLVFAGRPGMGKTSFLLSAALNIGRTGKRVAFYEMEMPQEQISQRLLSIETGINLQAIRSKRNLDGTPLTPQQVNLIGEAMERLSQYPIFIDDTPALDPATLKAKIKRLYFQHGLDLVVIDHLGEMNTRGKVKAGFDETTYIMRYIKDEIARDPQMRLPVILASQLNRAVEDRKDKRPVLSDLRSSGEVEQKADAVVFLYRDAVYNDDTEFPNQADLIVAKHRNGRTGTASLYFDNTITKFMNSATHSIDLSDWSGGDVDPDWSKVEF